MPWAPKRPCGRQGCAELVDSGLCATHQKEQRREYDATRKDDPFRKIYSSRRWRAVRLLHLEREPLCRACKEAGRVVAAEMVDHIVPIRQGGDVWAESNHQSLCWPCHSAKSIRDGSRYGAAPVRTEETETYVIA